MSAENVRTVLFRTLIDSDFYNLMLVNPDEALKDYDLTDDERKILITPDKNLYKLLGGTTAAGLNFNVSVNIVLMQGLLFAIPIIVTPSSPLKEEDQKIVQLVNSIQNAVGQERFANIMQLVEEMQKEK